jgi:WD40 repeat protein
MTIFLGERIVRAHPDAKLTCLQFDKNKLVTGASDSTIKIWNAVTGDLFTTLDAKGTKSDLLTLTSRFWLGTLLTIRTRHSRHRTR